jgi:hypothetical protein
MAKPKSKLYSVTRRYSVYVTREVRAGSFDEAVAAARDLGFDELVTAADGASVIDFEALDGFGVQEDFTP